jgi:membrane protease YdiL (CAAX protease family)
MNTDLIWQHEYIKPVISLSVTLACFLIYHYASNSDKIISKIQKTFGINYAMELRVYLRQISGFIFLGCIPALAVLTILPGGLAEYGLRFSIGANTLYYTLLLAIIVVVINFFASKSPFNLERYPLIRIKDWNAKLLIFSSLGWIIYLIGYEFLFRGFLLFTCIDYFGIWPSVAINILVYSFAHIPQGFKETAGAIPFGFILCYFTILSGTIWAALILHIVLALSNEWFSIYNNDEISVRFFSSGDNKKL